MMKAHTSTKWEFIERHENVSPNQEEQMQATKLLQIYTMQSNTQNLYGQVLELKKEIHTLGFLQKE